MPDGQVVSVAMLPKPHRPEVSGEVMLDLEVIAGACPGATQVVYFGSPQFDEKAWVDILGHGHPRSGQQPLHPLNKLGAERRRRVAGRRARLLRSTKRSRKPR